MVTTILRFSKIMSDAPWRLASYNELSKINNGNSRKFRCPSCGKLSFTPYIFTESVEAIDVNECGRCDHEESCQYHLEPKTYFERYPDRHPFRKFTPEEKEEFKRKRAKEIEALRHEKWLMKVRKMNEEFGFQSSSDEENNNILEKGQNSPSKTISRHDWSLVSLYEKRALESNLFKFLCTIFESSTVEEVFKTYHIGTDKKGRVIFWQIDHLNEVRGGKVMKYDDKGHRAKTPEGDPERGSFTWVHSELMKVGQLRREDWKLEQCFFGSHLLNGDDLPPEAICLVEAEKTAIIAACQFPEYTWIATGGKENLKGEKLAPLWEYSRKVGCPVLIYADLGAEAKWREKLEPFADVLPYVFSDYLENHATEKARAKGMDLADFILGEF